MKTFYLACLVDAKTSEAFALPRISVGASVLIALSAMPYTVHAQQSELTSAADAKLLEEILVTAQKCGEERLQDVPVPMAALNTQPRAAGPSVIRAF